MNLVIVSHPCHICNMRTIWTRSHPSRGLGYSGESGVLRRMPVRLHNTTQLDFWALCACVTLVELQQQFLCSSWYKGADRCPAAGFLYIYYTVLGDTENLLPCRSCRFWLNIVGCRYLIIISIVGCRYQWGGFWGMGGRGGGVRIQTKQESAENIIKGWGDGTGLVPFLNVVFACCRLYNSRVT